MLYQDPPILHEHWLAFRRGERTKEEVLASIYQHIMNCPSRFKLHRLAPDERHDLLAGLYPRLLKALERYRDSIASFDAYVHSILHWGEMELKKKEARRVSGELVAWQYRCLEMVHEDEAPYSVGQQDGDSPCEQPARVEGSRRQQLVLILKTAPLLGESTVRRLALRTGFAPELLTALVEQVNTISLGHQSRLEYQRKMQDYRSRIVVLRGLLEDNSVSGKERENIERRLAGLEDRKRRLAQSQGRQACSIRNWQIAKVLGISQSTVSAALRFYTDLEKLRSAGKSTSVN